MSKLKKTTLYVNGMHCPSCDVLINDKFREEGNVVEVKPDFKKQKVEVFYTGRIDKVSLNNRIKKFGYEISDGLIVETDSLGKRVFEAFGIGAILVILYLIANELSLIPEFNFNGNLSLLTIFGIGLVASTSTCMATSGALFLSTVGKSRDNFSQSLFFNLGRIFSYGVFGFLAGLIGQVLITNLNIGPFLTLIAAIFMILLGLDMAKVLSIGKIIP